MPHFRRSERAQVQLHAELRSNGPGSALTRAGAISDLSLGGAYIQTTTAPQPGAQVWLRIVAPTAWDPLDLEAEVRWVEAGGFGVRFTGMSETEATALRALVELAGFGEEA